MNDQLPLFPYAGQVPHANTDTSRRGGQIIHGHGTRLHRSPTYKSWQAMIRRCTSPISSAYRNYGGRGIQVCPQWRTFAQFLADMGERPTGTTLDRRDNDGNYEPTNCRWATASEQARNRRPQIACRKGHVFSSSTTYSFPSDGQRRCLICIRERKNAWERARRRAAKAKGVLQKADPASEERSVRSPQPCATPTGGRIS